MTHPPRHPLARDDHGNLAGWVTLDDGSVESIAELDAWADDYDAADEPPPLAPARAGRPSLSGDGVSPKLTVRVPADLLDRLDEAAGVLGRNRGDLVRVAVTRLLDTLRGPVHDDPDGAGADEDLDGDGTVWGDRRPITETVTAGGRYGDSSPRDAAPTSR